MDTKSFVSIIIPALNEEKNIGRCLKAIDELNTSKDCYEVIVVDNGSMDKTVDIAKDFNAQVFIKPKINISSLRNFGAKIAKGDIFAFVDADCVIVKNWLKEAIKELKNYDTGATGSNYLINPEEHSWVAKVWEFNTKGNEQRCEVDWIQSGNLIIKRKCFEELGGFNEQLNVCEDSDICYRIKDKGYKIISNPAICSYHLGFPSSLKSFFKKQLWHGRDVLQAFFTSKNKKRYLKILVLTIFFLISVLTLIISILFRRIELAILSLFVMILVSFVSAIKTSIEKKEYKYIIPLTLLYITFGIARALCLVDIRNWRTK